MDVKNLGKWGCCYGPRERRGDHSKGEVHWGVGVWGLKVGVLGEQVARETEKQQEQANEHEEGHGVPLSLALMEMD